MQALNIITFTNKGYIDYTKNLLDSNKLNNVNLDLKVYTLDDYSYKYFSDIHENVVLFNKVEYYRICSIYLCNRHLLNQKLPSTRRDYKI